MGTWCLITDQTPDDKEHTSNGHTKGDMAFDANGGFWLVHSVPRFPAATGSGSYAGYPAYAKEYGQSFICMSYGALSSPHNHPTFHIPHSTFHKNLMMCTCPMLV